MRTFIGAVFWSSIAWILVQKVAANRTRFPSLYRIISDCETTVSKAPKSSLRPLFEGFKFEKNIWMYLGDDYFYSGWISESRCPTRINHLQYTLGGVTISWGNHPHFADFFSTLLWFQPLHLHIFPVCFDVRFERASPAKPRAAKVFKVGFHDGLTYKTL